MNSTTFRPIRAAVLACGFALALAGGTPAAADLEVGDAAPSFSLAGSDGQAYTLEGLLAKHKGVVLAWFPKAFTPG